MTKFEKAVIGALFISTGVGFFFLTAKVMISRKSSIGIVSSISVSAKLTDKMPLDKGIYFNREENEDKLNLNRTDLRSIKSIPDMSSGMAKAIHNFVHIKSNGSIESLEELLKIKGFNRNHLKKFEPYITVLGGHAGFAAWGDKLNLNFARAEDLSALPGISKKVANNIIKFRDSNGNFNYIEELLDVEDMTTTAFKKISKMVTTQ